MASTRNKNTASDYSIQQKSYKLSKNYVMSTNKRLSNNTALPELGVFANHIPNTELSHNPTDIESSLFGINSTNLVEPQPKVIPQFKQMPTVKFYDRVPLIKNQPYTVKTNNRPFPVPM